MKAILKSQCFSPLSLDSFMLFQEEEVALTDDVSHRLAVVNLDWDHVRVR